VPPEPDVRGRLEDILEAIERIVRYTADHDATSFAADSKTRDAVVWNLTLLGEATRGIPVSLQQTHPRIPWAKLRGLRNFLVHEYFGIDDRIVWTTATSDVVRLEADLRALLLELES
jgi:uncharacterized protein with HEPN domain